MQQHAAGNAFFVADCGGLHGARLGALWQHDAFVAFACGIHHIHTELRRRHAAAGFFQQQIGVDDFLAGAEIHEAGFLGNGGTCTGIAASLDSIASASLPAGVSRMKSASLVSIRIRRRGDRG